MYKIKQIPQDFVVKEINELNLDNNGGYSYYLLKKTNYNTVDAIRGICDVFRVREKYANFAGTKDKIAVTQQYISVKNGPKKDLELKDISLKFVGKGKERLNLGSLQGNSFEIVVRNIEKKPKIRLKFVNYFDSQRFGKEKNNHIVGKHIIKDEYDKACSLIPETKKHLKEKPNDFIGALRTIPKNILKLYVHAYQSHLWNMAAKKINKDIILPIVGFGTEFENEKVEEVYGKIMKDENIILRDFVNKKIPELSEEGSERSLFVKVKELYIGKLEEDELNKGKKKVIVKFSLPKGAYATNVIKELFA